MNVKLKFNPLMTLGFKFQLLSRMDRC